jgi:1-acyl-sn-glycerol-3-phosphate acyltransferase
MADESDHSKSRSDGQSKSRSDGHGKPQADEHIKRQVYKDPRPAETFDRYHAMARTHTPDWIYEVVRVVTVLAALVFYRVRGFGAENVPNGAVIIVPNHASSMDHFFIGGFVRRHIQFMAKSQMFGRGPMSWIYSHGGVYPVRRGHRDEESVITSQAILDRGGAIGIYVEGGRSRTGNVAVTGKRGVGRLALESGAPIVPVAIFGSIDVRHWMHLRFPKVVVRFGRPLRFEPIANPGPEQQQRVADEILARIRKLYDELEQAGPRGAARAARAGVLADR